MTATRRERRVALARSIALELLVVVSLFLAYRFGRLLVGHSSAEALDHASELIGWEHAVGLPSELGLQQLMLSSETVTRLANIYYATVHFPLTALFLVWLFVRSRDDYRRIRTSMALLTAMALMVHAAFPLAPARMLHGFGFVDTAAMYGPNVYSSAPNADSVANQFAAMPSLHFGWAVVVAMGIIRVSRSRWRWLWIAHPMITLLVIVATGNHYWTDAAVAGVLLIGAEYAVRTWTRVGGRGIRVVRRSLTPVAVTPSTRPSLVAPTFGGHVVLAGQVRRLPARRGPPARAGPAEEAAYAA
ncbi:MAG TPA: phosphatase PAP2 family protein [Nocardioidaceae bacterium]|nr:phosphatase PAP2 family protein [Nocardioidaceae bacterium]